MGLHVVSPDNLWRMSDQNVNVVKVKNGSNIDAFGSSTCEPTIFAVTSFFFFKLALVRCVPTHSDSSCFQCRLGFTETSFK